MNKTPKLLLIEDNSAIAQQVLDYFTAAGWACDYASKGQQGLALALAERFDVLLLDLNLPDMDGLEVCQQLRAGASYYLPIMMVTARDAMDHKEAGYLQGADDYVTKPFDLRELLLKCVALSRRPQLHQEHLLQLGELSLDSKNNLAIRDGQPLKLTQIAFNILLYLARNHPNIISRSELIHHLWGDNPPETDALRSHIYQLRNQLDKPFSKALLKTVAQVGYRLDLP